MSAETGHNPWVFHRDEIDVLEDEFDAVFARHEADKDPVSHALEEDVLREQLDTEDAAEADLIAAWGPPSAETPPAPGDAGSGSPGHASHDLTDIPSLRAWLKQDVARDPFYEQALIWSSKVSRFAHGAYQTGNGPAREAFRAYVNALVMPAKLAFAQTEETHEHEDALDIAQKEYQLAATYLDRARESLGRLRAAGALGPGELWMLEEGRVIADRLTQIRGRLANAKPVRPF